MQRELQAVFAEELAPTAGELGTVLVVDESSFVKRGRHSVGVARQHCGRLGKVENCQVGVFVVGVTPTGRALLEHQLYLPQEWAHDQPRRATVEVPAQLTMQTKPQLAATLVQRILDNGFVKPQWVTADEGYGKDRRWRDEIAALGLYYVAEVPKNKSVWLSCDWLGDDLTPRRATAKVQAEDLRSVSALAAQAAPDQWHTLLLREGSNEPLAFEFAFFQVWDARNDRQAGPPVWVIARRTLEGKDEKYYLSNAPRETPPPTLAQVSGYRFRVEQYFGDGKGEFGMADYEARGWHSWHHHMSLVAMAHLFAMLTNRDLRHDEPRMTIECALRILQDALPRPTLGQGDSLRIIEYHLNQAEQAAKSKRKKWLQRHPKVSL